MRLTWYTIADQYCITTRQEWSKICICPMMWCLNYSIMVRHFRLRGNGCSYDFIQFLRRDIACH